MAGPNESFKPANELEASRLVSSPLNSDRRVNVVICKEPETQKLQTWLEGTSAMDQDTLELPAVRTQILGFGNGKWKVDDGAMTTDRLPFTLADD
eukprot:9322680-Karenia_brevis.AAC.1